MSHAEMKVILEPELLTSPRTNGLMLNGDSLFIFVSVICHELYCTMSLLFIFFKA